MTCSCNRTPCNCTNTPSCLCNQVPCTCCTTTSTAVASTTLCNLDRRNNVWVEGADADGNSGICLLDTITEDQFIGVIQRDPLARTDLVRVTDNAYLLNLAAITPMLPTVPEGDELQRQMNQNTMVLYTVFKGVPPFNQ